MTAVPAFCAPCDSPPLGECEKCFWAAAFNGGYVCNFSWEVLAQVLLNAAAQVAYDAARELQVAALRLSSGAPAREILMETARRTILAYTE